MPDRRSATAAGVLIGLAVAGGLAYGVASLLGSGGDDASSPTSAAVHLPHATHRPHRATPSAQPQFQAEPVYYLGDGPRGPVLFSQSVIVLPGVSRLDTAVNGLQEKPELAAHRTEWKPGWITGASRHGDLIDVAVDAAPSALPSGMEQQTAVQSVQQVVYTMQAASGSHDRIRFTRNGKPTSSVLGVPTGGPVAAAPVIRTESLVSIEEPEVGGSILSRGPVPVSGLADTAHGQVEVRLERGGRVVRAKAGHTAGTGDLGRLSPWKVVIDTTGLPNGHYLIVASGPDPTDPSVTAVDQRPLFLAGHH